jgi:hypothetical protein
MNAVLPTVISYTLHALPSCERPAWWARDLLDVYLRLYVVMVSYLTMSHNVKR